MNPNNSAPPGTANGRSACSGRAHAEFRLCRLNARSARVSTAAIDLVNESLVIDMLGLLTREWSTLDEWKKDPATFTEADFHRSDPAGLEFSIPQ